MIIDINPQSNALSTDFNITADTSITASWNTVSSGDGLNFID